MSRFVFFKNDGSGNFVQNGDNVLDRDWTHSVAGNFGLDPLGSELFLYDKTEGIGALYAVDGQGNMSPINANALPTQTKGWDLIIRGNFHGGGKYDDLLFYDRDQGKAEFYAVEDNGKLRLLKGVGPGGWRRSWHQIVSGRFRLKPSDSMLATDPSLPRLPPGECDLLFYDRDHGTGEFYSVAVNTQIHGVRFPGEGGWRDSWDQIVPISHGLDHSGFDSLLFYDGAEGTGEFYLIDGVSGGHLVSPTHGKYPGGWSKDWDQIVSGAFTSANDVLFYQRQKRKVEIYPVDQHGKISSPKKLTPPGPFSHVVVGNFFPTAGALYPHDLVFHRVVWA